MTQLAALHYEALTEMARTFESTEEHIGRQLFPVQPIAGDTAKWDEIIPNRDVSVFVSRGSASVQEDHDKLSEKSMKMPYVIRSFNITSDELNNIRQIGSGDQVKDREGRAWLASQVETHMMVVESMREMLRWRTLRNPNAVTFDVGVGATNKQTKSVSFGTTASHVIATTAADWSTATTDISDDVMPAKKLISKESGIAPARLYFNDTVANHVMKNTEVRQLIGEGSSARAQFGQSGMVGKLMGLDWIQYDLGFSEGGTLKDYIEDNEAIMTPGAAARRWSEEVVGSVIVLDENGEETEVQSPGSYSYRTKDPVGHVVVIKATFFPVMKVPDAIVAFQDVTGP